MVRKRPWLEQRIRDETARCDFAAVAGWPREFDVATAFIGLVATLILVVILRRGVEGHQRAAESGRATR